MAAQHQEGGKGRIHGGGRLRRHTLLGLTERRNGFTQRRSLGHFQRQYGALITVGRRVWYQSGASADHRREVRPSHALQWRMIRDAVAQGADVYDMRGVPSTLDPSDRPFGLVRWKLGTGGEVAETLGEWDLPLHGPLNRTLHRALRAYLARR